MTSQPAPARLNWSTFAGPLIAAVISLAVAFGPSLVAYGFLQARVAATEKGIEELKRHEETGQASDREAVQRIARIEAKLDTVMDWLRRDRTERKAGLTP